MNVKKRRRTTSPRNEIPKFASVNSERFDWPSYLRLNSDTLTESCSVMSYSNHATVFSCKLKAAALSLSTSVARYAQESMESSLCISLISSSDNTSDVIIYFKYEQNYELPVLDPDNKPILPNSHFSNSIIVKETFRSSAVSA